MKRHAILFILLSGLWVLGLGCGPDSFKESAPPEPEITVPSEKPTDGRRPRFDIVESMRADLAAERHISDGGGEASVRVLLPTDGELRAGGLGRLRIELQVGPEGIAVGGAIYLQISPFWGWSTPQVTHPQAPGYTEIHGSRQEARLLPETLDQQLMMIRVKDAPLEVGDRVEIIYGAGEAAARVDIYAERGEPIYLAVDGDGDGVRRLLNRLPTVDIGPGPAHRLVALLPSTARPGESVDLHVSILDRMGNAGIAYSGELTVAGRTMESTSRASGAMIIPWQVNEVGVVRLEVSADGLWAETNPMLVAAQVPRVLWGDLQVHSNLSDGTGRPQDLYTYGEEVARLDVMAVTDHDHWGLRFLDGRPDLVDSIRRATRQAHRTGKFVALHGFEWTHWVHGHRHVLSFEEQPIPIFSSLDERFDHPSELWRALEGQRAMTVAHHSAGGPIAIDWTVAPDPILETVTEVVSVHGSSEAADSPLAIRRAPAGNSVREGALGRGYRLGFIGSSDGHDGHPGLAHLVSPSGGLAAIFAAEPTRDEVYRALQARRAYATSGPRIVLRTLLAGYRMGSEIPVSDGRVDPRPGDDRLPLGERQLWLQVVAPAELERVDWVWSDRVGTVPCSGRECSFAMEVGSLPSQGFLYFRAVQTDGHFAVSSPFFFVDNDDSSRPIGPVGS